MDTRILPNMIPMRDITQISDGDRLFYELGQKLNPELGYGANWISSGIFREFENVKEFIEGEPYLTNIKFLEHHNFMLIKGTN